MDKKKKYDGYKAFQYLEPGIDYVDVNLRKKEITEEWQEPVPLSQIEEEKFAEIMENNIVIDLHAHPNVGLEDKSQQFIRLRDGRANLAYEALSISGLDCIFDNLMNGGCFINTKRGWDWNGTIHDLGMKLSDIAHQDFVIHCKEAEDVVEAHKTGKLAWVAVIESSSCIENEVDRLDVLHGLGVRSMGINYSESNMLGSGLKELGDGGLTDFGYDAVIRMNKLGILVDVSHLSDQTALDTIASSKKPIICSHSGVRALTPTTRMFPDEVIQAIAERGGVMAIEAAPNLTVTEKNPLHSIESYMEHIEHCIDLVGIDYVGCGPDTLYSDHLGGYLHAIETSGKMGIGHYNRPERGTTIRHLGIDMDVEELKKLKYVRGMENPTECLQNVTRWMVKHGYSEKEIAKIIGGNGLRILKEVW